jgi:hypothetical protein
MPNRVLGAYPRGRPCTVEMRLQFLAILETGASKILPKVAGTVRVTLIYSSADATQQSGLSANRKEPARVMRRRIATLPATSA